MTDAERNELVEKLRTFVPWRPIATFIGPDDHKVDLWLDIQPSLQTLSFGDSFRVPDAWRKDGKWFHDYLGKPTEIRSELITSWMPIPIGPRELL